MRHWVLWTASDPIHSQGVPEPKGKLYSLPIYLLGFFVVVALNAYSSSDLSFKTKEKKRAGFKGKTGQKDVCDWKYNQAADKRCTSAFLPQRNMQTVDIA